MSSIIEWLNSNEGFVMSMLTFVYVVANIIIVYKMMKANKLTEKTIKSAQEQENERRRPRVIFDFVIERRCIFAEVRNEGITSAIDVKFEVPDALVEMGKYGKIEFPFTKPISYLSPNSKRKTLLSTGWELFGKCDKPEFTIKVSYQDAKGKTYKETIHHDLTYMKNITELGGIYVDQEIKRIRENLEKLEKTATKISNTHEALVDSPPPLRVSVAEARYSQKALAVARVFVEESKYGMRFDPKLRVEELVKKTKLTLDDVLEAINELEEGGFVTLHRKVSLASEDPRQLVIVENLLFVEFDRFWMEWDTEEDARRIATDMVNDEDFPSGLSNALKIKSQGDMLKQMKQIASRYNWKPRRLNPALCWLRKRKLATLHQALGTRGYVYFAIDGNFPALRRFIKRHRDEQTTNAYSKEKMNINLHEADLLLPNLPE